MIRSLVLLCALAGCLCDPRGAAAADYSAAYVVELRDFVVNGAMKDCDFERICEIKLEEDRGTLQVRLAAAGNGSVSLSTKTGCCFFADGTRTGTVTLGPSIQRFEIYAVRERRKGDYVPTKKIGDVYISISLSR